MKKCALTGLLILFVAAPSFAQDAASWGTHSLPMDRSEEGSLSGHNYSTEVGRIAGTVATLDGRPQPDVLVQIRDFGTGRILGSVHSNVAGGFSFDMLPYGNYEVVANEQAGSVREEIEVREDVAVVNLRLNTSDSAPVAPQSGLVSLTELRAPRRARDAYHKAEQAIANNRPAEVLKNLQKALEIYPAYAPALTLRGVLSMDSNDLTAAVEDFDMAIQRALQQLTHAQEQLPREYPALHLVRANAFLGLKDYSEAANELKIFLRIAPKDPNASAAQETLRQINAVITSGTQIAGSNHTR